MKHATTTRHRKATDDKRLKREIGTVGLLFTAVGSIIGSGWLLGALSAAQIVGPASIIAWAIGGVMVILIGLCYAELGTMFPVAWCRFHTTPSARSPAIRWAGSPGWRSPRPPRLKYSQHCSTRLIICPGCSDCRTAYRCLPCPDWRWRSAHSPCSALSMWSASAGLRGSTMRWCGESCSSSCW
jgi:hypothetical protein